MTGMKSNDHELLSRAIQLARENVEGGGGPFGALITFNGEVIAESANQVIQHNDPTAHAEVETIRLASRELNTFDLTGCTLYTSCEPCPMCLGAIYWSRISRVVYASTRMDAAHAGFRDAELYEEIILDPDKRSLSFVNLDLPEAGTEFEAWDQSEIRQDY